MQSVAIILVCHFCRRQHPMLRLISEPERIYMICHNCEKPMSACISSSDLRNGMKVKAETLGR